MNNLSAKSLKLLNSKKGIKYFISNDLDSAIEEFRLCKDYNPYHKDIDKKIKDLEEIKKLKKEGNPQ